MQVNSNKSVKFHLPLYSSCLDWNGGLLKCKYAILSDDTPYIRAQTTRILL
jgi:hypothetical protein